MLRGLCSTLQQEKQEVRRQYSNGSGCRRKRWGSRCLAQGWCAWEHMEHASICPYIWAAEAALFSWLLNLYALRLVPCIVGDP